ncbi:MAG TPA: ACP S-malonyltransferase [Phycisphaerae bacterium]|nr:ACP S-malonyltransferase [Phycisphaerae bacterium]
MTLALLCPGQGAQHVGMGRDFYNAFGVARRIYDQADKHLGFSLSKLCFEGPEEELNKTNIAQLGIFVTSVAIYETLLELGKTSAPDFAAGLSLGEYTALHAAGVISFFDALTIVKARGTLMQAAAEAAPSTMLALLGGDEATADAICAEAAHGEVLVPANFNTPGQIVLSGAIPACERAAKVAETKGCKAIPLKVAGAFHSPFMQSAADEMAQVLAPILFNAPKFPVISNVTAQPHTDGQATKDLLVRQVVAPVRWYQSIETLRGKGVTNWLEVGPGRTLTGMMKKIDRKAPVQNYSTTEGLAIPAA